MTGREGGGKSSGESGDGSSLDDKLDEALRGTFPASDPIELRPDDEPPPVRESEPAPEEEAP